MTNTTYSPNGYTNLEDALKAIKKEKDRIAKIKGKKQHS